MNSTVRVTHRIDRSRMLSLFLSLPVLLICSIAHSQTSVVLYENPNFGGRSKALVMGENTLSDFEGLTSSIKVPAGLVVTIFDHADDAGGYGLSVDLLEDCANLATYNLNDKVAYAIVTSSTKPGGYIWARNSLQNGNFLPGHWERARAAGNPVNTVAVVSPPYPPRGHPRPAHPVPNPQPASFSSDPGDLMSSPAATQSDIDEFNSIRDNQYGVGVLGGDTRKPFYYHHNQPNEVVYKYPKIVDARYFDGAALEKIKEKLGDFYGLLGPLDLESEIAHGVETVAKDIWETITSSHDSTLMQVDSWYPDSEFRATACGIMRDVHVCDQDFIHTKVIVDKDMNFDLVPNEKFKAMLKNRWAGDIFDHIEGEVKATNLQNYDTHTSSLTESLAPKNPAISAVRAGDDVCMFGPWMADILDLNVKVPVPFSSNHIDASNIDIQDNDEIHPINQMWIKRDNETQLISIVDKTGFFEKTSATEVQASGFNQRMRYYIAFEVPANATTIQEYQVNGIGFDFSSHPNTDVKSNIITLAYKGQERLKIDDNSFLKLHKTHTIFFDKTRIRSDGFAQGYIVVETEPIDLHGGSINIFVKKVH